jgi:hypothetical protein
LNGTSVNSSDVLLIAPSKDEGESAGASPDYINTEGEGEEETITVPEPEATANTTDSHSHETPLEESTPTTASGTPAVPDEEQLLGVCVSRTDAGLSYVLSKYNLPHNPEKTYYYFLCDDLNSPINCSEKIEITDHDIVQPQWWIEIPEINPKECIENGGSLLTDPN